jgi:hypothetical protein
MGGGSIDLKVSDQLHASAVLSPRERAPGTRWKGGDGVVWIELFWLRIRISGGLL